jgi:dTDP-glucose 4,6-dehydratase
MSVAPPLPAGDLDAVVEAASAQWPDLKGARVFFTGATGFFGRWLLESLLAADRRRGLGVSITALSRDPENFLRRAPHLAGAPNLSWIRGSVATLDGAMAAGRRFDFALHLATEADTQATLTNPAGAAEVIAGGTARTLEFARATGAKRVLFTSSGSVYGRQPADVALLPETFASQGRMEGVAPAYVVSGEAKRQAEELCRGSGLNVVIARGFTFAGPGMPLDGKFAFGNFLRDALAGRPIEIQGDGTPVRSYLYAADLAIWLWTLLLRGKTGEAYNVGSEQAVTLHELAEVIAREAGGAGAAARVLVARRPTPGVAPHRYVPSTRRARSELGLAEQTSLAEMVRRTADWHRAVKR